MVNIKMVVVINAISNNKEQKGNHSGEHKILMWKPSPTKRGKNHGRQQAKLHYMESVYKHRGLSNDAINPSRRLTRSINRRQQ
jgi:hypothetical protein